MTKKIQKLLKKYEKTLNESKKQKTQASTSKNGGKSKQVTHSEKDLQSIVTQIQRIHIVEVNSSKVFPIIQLVKNNAKHEIRVRLASNLSDVDAEKIREKAQFYSISIVN